MFRQARKSLQWHYETEGFNFSEWTAWIHAFRLAGNKNRLEDDSGPDPSICLAIERGVLYWNAQSMWQWIAQTLAAE